MTTALPGIVIISKTEIYKYQGDEVAVPRIRDGQDVANEDLGDRQKQAMKSGELVIVEYDMDVKAITDEAARRKAKGAVMVRHPADVLDISLDIAGQSSEVGVFSDIGPQSSYAITARVER